MNVVLSGMNDVLRVKAVGRCALGVPMLRWPSSLSEDDIDRKSARVYGPDQVWLYIGTNAKLEVDFT
jgi:hypothetical protein